MNDTCQIDGVVVLKAAWRAPTLNAYATALVESARGLYLDQGVSYFNNDDVADEHQPGDKTTVGAAFRMLIAAGVIEAWRGNDEAKGIWGGIRKSTRPECHGHRNQLYRLVSIGLADEWLARHGVKPAKPQREFAFV